MDETSFRKGPLWKGRREDARGKAFTEGTHGHRQDGGGAALGMTGGSMFDERDHVFATDVLNASLTLMSILVAVIMILAVEYKGVHGDPIFAKPIYTAVICTTVASVLAGVIALVALIQLRLRRWRTAPLALAFGVLIAIMTLGIPFVVYVEVV